MSNNIRVKPITTAQRLPDEVQVRDTFETPRYAVEMLIPYLKTARISNIWECAVGNGRISRVLKDNDFYVYGTDIRENPEYVDEVYNFVTDTREIGMMTDCIVTNPPFSIKDLFIEKALSMRIPFAFLINADYSGKTIDWIRRGCEKLVPTSRIAFITPNILRRIHEGEAFLLYKKDTGWDKEITDEIRQVIEEHYPSVAVYEKVDDVPQDLLYKYSSAQFHSMWLTYGLGLGQSEVFVDLSVEKRKTRII